MTVSIKTETLHAKTYDVYRVEIRGKVAMPGNTHDAEQTLAVQFCSRNSGEDTPTMATAVAMALDELERKAVDARKQAIAAGLVTDQQMGCTWPKCHRKAIGFSFKHSRLCHLHMDPCFGDD